MRIIHNKKGHRLCIRPDHSPLAAGPDGTVMRREVVPELTLVFRDWTNLNDRERLLAQQAWNTRRRMSDPSFDAYGAAPSTMPPPNVPGGIGWTWEMGLSLFDTEWIDNPADREYAEDYLRGNPAKGIKPWTGGMGEFIIVEAAPLQKPWPTYDEIEEPEETGPGKHHASTRIIRLARDTGVDLRVVKAYELAVKNRPDVITALDEAIRMEDEKAVEDAALRVRVQG